MKRITLRVAGVMTLGLTAILGIESSASAAASPASASTVSKRSIPTFKLFKHDGYGTLVYTLQYPGTICYNLSGIANNSASSMQNLSGYRVEMHDSANCRGSAGYVARPNSRDTDLTNNGFDNKASSVLVRLP